MKDASDIINFLMLALVGAVGWLARNAFMSVKEDQKAVKDDQKAIWDRINNGLMPRTEFQIQQDHTDQKLDEVDKKLDALTAKLDEHFTWELNRERKYRPDNINGG